ncbi:efflux RND transporter periplasmic adaptor subunit [uncultured Sunxiuqinia sp.]|uniref:HlyD family secretion protein n=1 Tax=uncultured Sunxiuqinia sp. TaxID=1573825 RepID=UPI002AA6E804|nr:efflux RND transporter periplasmic adaptor subunit [uncultured Sunxiuqinia sp.]
MKIQYFLILALIALVSCNGNDDQSDAFGNFEIEEVIVSSEITGKLINFNLEQGDEVKQGQLLALVDTAQLSLQIEQLKAQKKVVASRKVNLNAQVEVQKEQIETLKIEQKRIHQMFAGKAATRQQVDDLDGKVRILEKQLTSIQSQFVPENSELDVLDAQLAIAKDKLGKCFISSLMDGVVLEKYLKLGELAASGKALVKLGDLSTLDLRVFVSGAQLANIKLGQQVEVLIDKNKDENQSLTGKVSWISPEAEFTPKIIQTKEERVKLVYAVKVQVKNDGRLKIGMPGEVNFQ